MSSISFGSILSERKHADATGNSLSEVRKTGILLAVAFTAATWDEIPHPC